MADRYAILIGSSSFPEEDRLQDLVCPARDVDDLHGLLSDPEHGGFTESHVLKNRPHHEVLRTVNRVLKKASKDDLVLIYYSGHGKLDQAGRLYLAAADTEFEALEATSIPVQSLKSYIDISPSTKTALILDCCYSGAVQKAFFRGEVDEQLNLMSGGRGTFIITASTGIQLAKEKEEDRNGVFTKHLIEGIRSGAADRDGDGYITMNEIYQYAHDRVIAESHQEPMKWDLNVRGELFVAKSGKTPREDRRKALRGKLLALAGEGLIPDEILSSALELAALPATRLDGRQKKLDQLLDDFLEERLAVGNFIAGWFKVQAEAPPPKAEAPPPPPPPKDEPPPRREQTSRAGQKTAKTSPWERTRKERTARAKPRTKPATHGKARSRARPASADAGRASSYSGPVSGIVFAILLLMHGGIAAGLASIVPQLSRWRSGSGSSFGYYYVDEETTIGYFAVAGVVLMVLLLFRRFFRRAANNLEFSATLYKWLFPKAASPRAALWASTLGILGFLAINALALMVEFDWMV